jgi:hypothetical protein
MMKTLNVSWQERLDDLYQIAGDTGATAADCDNEWWDFWLPAKRAGFDDVLVEPIPDGDWNDFCAYAELD